MQHNVYHAQCEQPATRSRSDSGWSSSSLFGLLLVTAVGVLTPPPVLVNAANVTLSNRRIEYWVQAATNPTVATCRTLCASKPGGFITTIESAAETALILSAYTGYNQVMIGGNRLATGDSTNWRWTEGPLGLENGGLGRIFYTSATTSTGGTCVGYCKWNTDSGEPNNGNSGSSSSLTEPVASIQLNSGGTWSDISDGAGWNAGCGCKRFLSNFFRVPLPPAVTTVVNDCNTACFQNTRFSYAAWILSATENAEVVSLISPADNYYYILGATMTGPNSDFMWTRTLQTFYLRSTSSCVAGRYCNFWHPPVNSSYSVLSLYGGSTHNAGLWSELRPVEDRVEWFGDCICRYAPETGTETLTNFDSPTATNSEEQSKTMTLSHSRTRHTPSHTEQRSKTLTMTASSDESPTVSSSPTETASQATVTDQVGFERFIYWFVGVTFPMQASCKIFCEVNNGFPAYATSEGENERLKSAVPASANLVLLGATRAYDGVNYRWVGGPLGARNQNHGAPFFNGPSSDTGGSCTLYCNFETGMPNSTSSATEVVMYGPSLGTLFGQWRNADPGEGDGCLCMRIEFQTFSHNVSRSVSVSVSLTSPNPYWFTALTSTPQVFSQCRTACRNTLGGEMAAIRSAYEHQMAMNVLPSNLNIGEVMLGGQLAPISTGSTTYNYYWSEGIFASNQRQIVWSSSSTLDGTGICMQGFCNFVTENITLTANLTLQEGPIITMWIDGPLRGYWGEGQPNNTKGCLCQRAEDTASARFSNSRSIAPSLEHTLSATLSQQTSYTTSRSPSSQNSNTITSSGEVTFSQSKTPSHSPSASDTDPPTFSNSLSQEASPSTTRSKTPGGLDFWFHPAPSATLAQCRKYCALRTGGFLAAVQNSVEAEQVFKTLPVNGKGMLGGSRLTDVDNFRWTEGPFSSVDSGLGLVFYSGDYGGTCVTYCNFYSGNPNNNTKIVHAYAQYNGQWVTASQEGNGNGCVCQRYNTYSLRLSPTFTRNGSSFTSTIITTPSTSETEFPTLSASSSLSRDPSISKSKTLKPSSSRSLVATPSSTTTYSRSGPTLTDDPTPSINTMTLSYQASVSVSNSGPTVTMTFSPDSSLSPTHSLLLSISPSKEISASKSNTNRTVGNPSLTKTTSPSQNARSETDSKELSMTASGTSDPSLTETLIPSFTSSKEVSSSLTASSEKSFSARSVSQTVSVTPSDTEETSMSKSSNHSLSNTQEVSMSDSPTGSGSQSVSLSETEAKTKSLRSPTPTQSKPNRTLSGSLSLQPTTSKRKHTRSTTLSAEPATPSVSRSFELSVSRSRSPPTPSASQASSRSITVSDNTPTSQVSASASRTPPNRTHSMSQSNSQSNSWEKTKASRSHTPIDSVTAHASRSSTNSEEVSPTRTLSQSSSGTTTYSTTQTETMSHDIASTTVTRSPIRTPSASLTAEKGTASLSTSQLQSASNSLSKEANTVTLSGTASLTVSKSAPSFTSDSSQTPTWIYSISPSKDLSMSLPTMTSSLTDDRSGSFTASITNTVRIPTKSVSVSDTRDVSASKSSSTSFSQEVTESVGSATTSYTISLSNTSELNSTTIDVTWSRAITATRSRGTQSRTSEESASHSLSISAVASFTRSSTIGTKGALTPTYSSSNDVSLSDSYSAQASVTAKTATFPTPSHTRSLILTPTPTLVNTPTHTISNTMSVSVSSSVSSTRSTSRDANTGTISMTPEKSASHTPSRTWTPPDPSHSVSFTASLLPSLTKPSLSLTASHTLSSDRTNTVTVQVSNSYRTPTIHTF
ncbi:Hypothetical protein, putative [Bodo saltans]|uniref:Uncharacterized protein n=1 Tax=Bodo saltans TaxID=75058 RepID=A0A0S4IMF3_BODSA|nr:Hypothetical protein, putative [Bodo saltans]|eukprot:CUF43590.1 Hypothetical protein, putative [Bodo saltans]